MSWDIVQIELMSLGALALERFGGPPLPRQNWPPERDLPSTGWRAGGLACGSEDSPPTG